MHLWRQGSKIHNLDHAISYTSDLTGAEDSRITHVTITFSDGTSVDVHETEAGIIWDHLVRNLMIET